MADRTLSSIPERSSEIAASWLETAVGAPAHTLGDFEVTRIGEGSGIVGVIARVALSWKVGAGEFPASVVVKLSPDDGELRSRYRLPMGREVRFYNDLASGCGARAPHAFHASFDGATGNAAIVMEDLGQATIYETGTAPAEAIVAVARSSAKLHARWWNDKRLAGMTWLSSPEVIATQFAGPARAALPRLVPWYEANAPDMLDLAVLRLDATERGGMPMPSLPPTLNHGDLGLKNVAFIEGEPIYFDWALVGRNTAPAELPALVSESYGAEVPHGLAEMIMPAYYKSLCEAGIAGVSYEQVREDFAVALMARSWAPLILLGVIQDAQRQSIALRWIETCRAFKDEFDFEGRLRRALG